MEKKFEKAIGYCVEALNIDDGQEVIYSNQDYVLKTLNKALTLPYIGRNLGIGDLRYQDYREFRYDRYSYRFKDGIDDSLSWLHILLILFDLANYDENKIFKVATDIANNNIMFNHVLKHIITNCIVLNDIELAKNFIPHFKATVIFKEEDNLDLGYLIILNHYAMKGDMQNFFKFFKQSKPAKNRYEVNLAKELLVNNYSLKNGVELGFDLCKHKNLGNKFHYNVLMALAEQGNYYKLKQVFSKYPDLKQPELETELKVLSQAYFKSKELKGIVEDDFEVLFDRAINMERKLKWGDVKLQDAVFANLYLASKDNKERMLRCRKAIKNNSLKRELVV